MIDDAFLRQVAALQANLKMLESQSDTLTELADMKELRRFKARLADYIEAHASAGHLPRDPFQVIEQRLIDVAEFFAAADHEYQRLKSWKSDWFSSIPAVGLADLQSARTELDELVAAVPRIQESLAQSLSPRDWDPSSTPVDLHADFLACAQCVNGLKLPQKAEQRHDLYQFTRGEGLLANEVSSHFTALGLRIDELVALHSSHVKAVADSERYASNHDFRSARKAFMSLGRNGFLDINYETADADCKMLEGVFEQFTSLDSSLRIRKNSSLRMRKNSSTKKRPNKNEYEAVKEKFNHLHRLAIKPDSELGRESLPILRKMESRFDAEHASSLVAADRSIRRRRITILLTSTGLIAVLVLGGLHSVNVKKKAAEAKVRAALKADRAKAEAEREAVHAKDMAERKAAEAIVKLKAGIGNELVGVTIGVPLPGGPMISFSYCPAGIFTMGSPASEEGHSSDENQVEVTLSKGFWMAKTEVTQAQWLAVMGSNSSRFRVAQRPMNYVTWPDALAFIKTVNESDVIPDGWKMALPTEAQWEYACRAGESGPYSGGTVYQVAWYAGNTSNGFKNVINPVGTKKPNAWGLYDMHGNVWEWCADWYSDTLPGGTDPVCLSRSRFDSRVLRGGSGDASAYSSRAASRDSSLPDDKAISLGFRPVLIRAPGIK